MSSIAAFSGDGRVFRAFGHLVAAKPGELLLVPLGRTTGDLRAVVDGCPVPWEEVSAVIETPMQEPRQADPEAVCRDYRALAALSPYGWVADVIPAFGLGRAKSVRLTHISGIRFARA